MTRYDGLAALLAPAEQRYYGEAFRHRQVEITGVGVDTVDGNGSSHGPDPNGWWRVG